MLSEKDIDLFEKKTGYTFGDKKLLLQALTHSSYANERRINKLNNYERLEFLGDAVLELLTSHFLFSGHQEMSEGEMTKLRASLVCEGALANCARRIDLDKFILLGKGEEQTGGRKKDSIISDVMEAVIGAIYLDGGIESAETFIKAFVLFGIEERALARDSKTMLQEEIQQDKAGVLSYEVVGEEGPEHDKMFVVRLFLSGKMLSEGRGRTKKAAEQQAAQQALQNRKKN